MLNILLREKTYMADDSINEISENLVETIIDKVKRLNIDQQRYILRQIQKFDYIDRRQFKRFRCEHLVVGFDVEGSQTREPVKDISEGGAFIGTSVPVTIGQKAILTFADKDGRAQCRINTTIVRAIQNGVAVVFDADNAHQRLKLKSIMNYVKSVGVIIDE
jgi:FAD synthase